MLRIPLLLGLGGVLNLLSGLAVPVRADDFAARARPLELKPYVLLQLDEAGTFNQSSGGGQAAGFNTRRARLGFEASLGKAIEAGVIWDFGGMPGSHSRLFEADIAYTDLSPFVIRGGVFKPSFTLEYAQSAADILFLERASIVNIVGGLAAGAGRVGAEIGANGTRWFAAALWTGGQTGPGAQSDQRAVLGRLAGLPVQSNTMTVHLGVSAAWLYQAPRDAGKPSFTLSDQPELQIDNADPSLSTGPLQAHGAKMGGLEAGLGWGGVWLQGEWYGLRVDCDAGPDPVFSGWYVQGAHTVLGTPRKWSPKTGAWGRPKSSEGFHPGAGQWGAVEFAGRFSTVDLNDAGVRGGRQRVWTAGANWYPIDPVRITLQYEHASVTEVETPRHYDAVALRTQLRF